MTHAEILRDQLRAGLDTAGWTQRDLSEATGLDQPSISRILSGAINPGWSTVCRIAEALEIVIATKRFQK